MNREKPTEADVHCGTRGVCPELGQLINSIRVLTENVDKLRELISKVAEEMHNHDSHAVAIEREMKKVRECVETQMSNLVDSHIRTQHNLEKLSGQTSDFIEHERVFYQDMILQDRKHDQSMEKGEAKTNAWVIKKKWAILGGIVSAIVTILILLVEYYQGA